jgi:hypothetical protein
VASIPISFSFLGPTSSTYGFVLSAGGAQAPLVPSFGVFKTAARPVDRVPPGTARQLVGMAGVMPGSGRVELRSARLLATGIGPSGARLYAAPTTRGRICYVVASPLLTFNCLRQLDHGLFVQVVDRDGPGGHAPYVFGLADDSVASVRLEVGRTLHDARLSRNAFTYTLPRAGLRAQAVRALVVTRRDGSSQRFTLNWPG